MHVASTSDGRRRALAQRSVKLHAFVGEHVPISHTLAKHLITYRRLKILRPHLAARFLRRVADTLLVGKVGQRSVA